MMLWLLLRLLLWLLLLMMMIMMMMPLPMVVSSLCLPKVDADGSGLDAAATAAAANDDDDDHKVTVHFHSELSPHSLQVSNTLPLFHIFDQYRRDKFISTKDNLRFLLDNCEVLSDFEGSLFDLNIRGDVVFTVVGPQISQSHELEESEQIVGGPLKEPNSSAALTKKRKLTYSDVFYSEGAFSDDSDSDGGNKGNDIYQYSIERLVF
jgi:hypothetical protein